MMLFHGLRDFQAGTPLPQSIPGFEFLPQLLCILQSTLASFIRGGLASVLSTKMKSLPSSPLLVQGNAGTFPEVCSPGLTTGALSSPFIVLSNSWPQSDSAQWLLTLSGHPRQRAHFRASTPGHLLEAPLGFACLGPEWGQCEWSRENREVE